MWRAGADYFPQQESKKEATADAPTRRSRRNAYRAHQLQTDFVGTFTEAGRFRGTLISKHQLKRQWSQS